LIKYLYFILRIRFSETSYL